MTITLGRMRPRFTLLIVALLAFVASCGQSEAIEDQSGVVEDQPGVVSGGLEDPISELRRAGICPKDDYTSYDHAPLVPFLEMPDEWYRVDESTPEDDIDALAAESSAPIVIEAAIVRGPEIGVAQSVEIDTHSSFRSALKLPIKYAGIETYVGTKSLSGDSRSALFVLSLSDNSFAFAGFCTTDALTVPFEERFGNASVEKLRGIIGWTGASLVERIGSDLPKERAADPLIEQQVPGLDDNGRATSASSPVTLIVSSDVAAADPDAIICVRSAGVLGDCVAASEAAKGTSHDIVLRFDGRPGGGSAIG